MISRTEAEEALEDCASVIDGAADEGEQREACKNMLALCLELLRSIVGGDEAEALYDTEILYDGLDSYGGAEAASVICGHMNSALRGRFLPSDIEDAFRLSAGMIAGYIGSRLVQETEAVLSSEPRDVCGADSILDRYTEICENALDYHSPNPMNPGLVMSTVEMFISVYEGIDDDGVRDHCMFSILELLLLQRLLCEGRMTGTDAADSTEDEVREAYVGRGYGYGAVKEEVAELLRYRGRSDLAKKAR